MWGLNLLALLAWLQPGSAQACSCAEPRLDREVVPADGSVDFPVDGQVRIFLTGGYPAPLRARLGEEYRLIGPEGPVAFTAAVEHTRLDLRPVAPLAPQTRYVLEAVFAYDAAGQRLDDEDRAARGPARTERRYWFPVVTFTTGERAGAPATRVPDLAEVRIDHRVGGGDCGPGTSLLALWRPVPLAPFETYALEVQGHGVVKTSARAGPPYDGRVSLTVSDTLCTADPYSLAPKTQRAERSPEGRSEPRTLRARLVVLGPSGTRSETLWTRSFADSSLFGHFEKRTPVEKPLPDQWFVGTPSDPPAQAPVGPPACPHGLEAGDRWEVDAHWTPRTYESTPAVGPAAGGAAALVQAEAGGLWVRVGAQPAREPIVAGRMAGGVLGLGGGAVLAVHPGDADFRLTALAADGTPRWTRSLAQQHINGRRRVAWCQGRFVAAWQQIDEKAFQNTTLHWALLDADGHTIARGPGERTGMIDGLGLGCHGDGFALVTPTVPGHTTPVLRLIDPQGQVKVVPAPALAGQTWSITRWRAGSAIATTQRRGGVHVVLLDGTGAVIRVIEVARGRNDRKPAVAAWGELLAVAWETWPGQKAWATVLDTEGRVAEPIALGRGLSRMTTAISAPENGPLVVGAVRDIGFEIEALRCRVAPGPGAPLRLTIH
jgi:hypothetical protein